MKVGGNGSASEFFNKHGRAALLTDSDRKKKYSSRVAELYREELARRVKDDVARCVFWVWLTHPIAEESIGIRTVFLSKGWTQHPPRRQR